MSNPKLLMKYRILVLTETHIPANPEHPEQNAPKRNENPMRIEKLKPEILEIVPYLMGKFNGLSLIPYRRAKMKEKTRAYLKMVPYCCLKKPSDPSNMVAATSFILEDPVFYFKIQMRICFRRKVHRRRRR